MKCNSEGVASPSRESQTPTQLLQSCERLVGIFMTQGFKANPGLKLANAFSVTSLTEGPNRINISTAGSVSVEDCVIDGFKGRRNQGNTAKILGKYNYENCPHVQKIVKQTGKKIETPALKIDPKDDLRNLVQTFPFSACPRKR